MKLYCGIDLHSNNSVIVILDEADRTVYERRLPNDLEMIITALAPYREQLTAIAVESTYNWYWLVDGLMEAGYTVKLVNTAAVTVYSGLKYTDDEHDARHLAHLLRLGVLPTGHIYPKAERSIRDLLRKRAQLVRLRTIQILSVENLISRNGGVGMTKQQIQGLDEAGLLRLCAGDALRAQAIESNRIVWRCLDEQIAGIERVVLAQAKLKPAFAKLLTVTGIWNILGMTIMYETGDLGRFARVGQYASYARCVGSSRWSNAQKKGTGNRKNGNKYLAWAYLEAAHHAIRSNGRIHRYYQRKKSQTNGIVALKAIAHKLARACYHVLKDQTPFEVDRAFA